LGWRQVNKDEREGLGYGVLIDASATIQAGVNRAAAPARPLPDTIALLEELTDFSVIRYKLTSGSSHSEVKARDE